MKIIQTGNCIFNDMNFVWKVKKTIVYKSFTYREMRYCDGNILFMNFICGCMF